MKIVTVIGARPQFIKAAAISRAIQRHNDLESSEKIVEMIVHTGQHYDPNMSEIFFRELEIRPPQYNLEVGSGGHGDQTGEILKRIEPVLVAEKPDAVVVYGDTNSTLAGALAAAKLHQPVVHVEAGLRSWNRNMPEEINRVVADHLSTLLLCPTETAVKNLEKEGITRGVHRVGDVMQDVLFWNLSLAEKTPKILSSLSLRPDGYVLVTVHRAENTDDTRNLSNIVEALSKIAATGETVVFPVHPRTRRALEGVAPEKLKGLILIEPLGYRDMVLLEKNAKMIFTDSGGVQKESHWLGVPCAVLRNETEWIETLQSGNNVLVRADASKIRNAYQNLARPERKTGANRLPENASDLHLKQLLEIRGLS